MKKHPLLLLVFSFYFLVSPVSAQTWRSFNTRNSQILDDNILSITLDRKGILWVGTTKGLCGMKDNVWTDYNAENEKLRDQFINCVVTEGRRLWIGTDDYGIIELNNNRWTEHSEETRRLNMKYIRDIAVDHQGVKWIGVTLSGLVQYEGVNWTKYTSDDSGLLSDFILCVVVDRRDRKWIGTNDGLCSFDGNRWTSYTTKNSRLPHNICLTIAIDNNNVKWVGTLEGLCRIEGDSWTVYTKENSPIPGEQVNALAFDEEGLLWMATDGGVAVFDGKDRWDVFPADGKVLPRCMFQKVCIGADGDRWFGTDEKGLFRLSGYKGIPGDNLADASNEDPENSGGSESTAKTETPERPAKSDEKGGDERVKLTPFLADGYITISMGAAEAEVTFLNAAGEEVRKVPKYRNGSRLSIAKMKKGAYSVKVKTAKGTRTVKFTLK